MAVCSTMGRRRGGAGNVHLSTLKNVRAVILGKDGVGKSGRNRECCGVYRQSLKKN